MVHHNSRHALCTISDDQTGLHPYEVRVCLGKHGADILNIARGTKMLVVHKDNVDVQLST